MITAIAWALQREETRACASAYAHVVMIYACMALHAQNATPITMSLELELVSRYY